MENGKRKNTENRREKSQLDLCYCKSLLRVRGITELEAKIEEKLNELSDLVTEAKEYYRECMGYRFVMRIMYQQSPISYKGMPKLNTDILHIPIMNFTSTQYEGNTVIKRQVVFSWENISTALDEANASLDERLLHMRVYYAFKDFYCRSRGISQELSSLYHSKAHFEKMIQHEKMAVHNLPKFMTRKLSNFDR